MSAHEYEKMRRAIQEVDYNVIRTIVQSKRFEINRTGGTDDRTGLHTAVTCDDPEAIDILMSVEDIDPNKKTSEGFTPLMLASKEVRMPALEKLLEYHTINIKARNHQDLKAEDLFPRDATHLQKTKCKILFQLAADRGKGATPKERNVAILIAICNYEESSGMSKLPGTKRDQEEMRIFLEPYYTVYCISDAKDILNEVEGVMETLPEGSVDNVQFLFSGDLRLIAHINTIFVYIGHGEHRVKVQLGRLVAENDTMESFDQDEAFGDVLISATGVRCTTDELIWVLLESGELRALTTFTSLCLIFDMCR